MSNRSIHPLPCFLVPHVFYIPYEFYVTFQLRRKDVLPHDKLRKEREAFPRNFVCLVKLSTNTYADS
jgi:hypothetical protein